MEGSHPAFILALALAVGVVAQSAARRLRVPGIVLLLLAGTLLGPDFLGWVRPQELGAGLMLIVDLAVAVILFEGGLNLEVSRLRREGTPIRRLVTTGGLITLLGGTVAAHLLLEWDWVLSLLFGSLVVVTGPTVVGPLIQELRLRPRVATVLEAEGVLIDPIGAIVALLFLEAALTPSGDSIAGGTAVFVLRLGFGLLAGVAWGFAIAGVLRTRNLLPDGHENIFTLAAVLLLFEGSDVIVEHSGVLAVTIGGVVVGNLRTRVDRDLREFKDQLSVMLIGLLFVLLAADVRLAEIAALGWPGLSVLAALVFVVRPLTVAFSTWGSELAMGERVLVGWIAPRGIVAAAVASLTAAALDARELPGGAELRALVFLVIAGTVLLAGLTALPLAALLGLRLPARQTVAILGAQGLGMALGRELQKAEVPLIFLDSNPENCRRAQEAGFPVVYGDALQERTLARARFEAVGVAVGLTSNQMLNSVFVSRARERFAVPESYVAVVQLQRGLALELVERGDARVLFDGRHDVARWDVRAQLGDLEVESWVYRGADEDEPPEEAPAESDTTRRESYVLLAIRRGERFSLMYEGRELKPDDVAAVAVYAVEREAAAQALRARGFEPNVESEGAAA